MKVQQVEHDECDEKHVDASRVKHSLRNNKSTSIGCHYVIALNIPAYQDHDGVFYVDALWLKDLELHREYIEFIELVCPVVRVVQPPTGAQPLATVISGCGIRLTALSCSSGWASALLRMPEYLLKLARAIGRARVVHTNVAGWPYPLGWLAVPMSRMLGRGRLALIVIESAPWRLPSGKRHSLFARFRADLFERMARFCVAHADICVFTHAQYRDSLMPHSRAKPHGSVINASWIDDELIISNEEAKKDWAEKSMVREGFKCLFAGRLVEEKGILIVLEAFASVPPGLGMSLDILGDGPLRDACLRRHYGCENIRFLDAVSYDPEFFSLLRKYHVLIVPGVSDEQPRVIYDAFSQALAVVASDTPGNRSCIEDGVTGTLFATGSARALLEALVTIRKDMERCVAIAMNGLEKARQFTHRRMHEERRLIIEACLKNSMVGGSSDR